MKLHQGTTSPLAALLAMAVICPSAVAQVRGTGLIPGQAARAAGSPTTQSPQPKVLTLEQRADIFMARKNYEDAADYYYRALKQTSFKSAVLWNKLGIAFQEQSKFHSALKAYSSATRIDKSFAEAWNNQGTVLYMEKKYSRSVKYYKQAIEANGDNATFHINLGISYSRVAKYPEAVQEYRTALAIDPNVLSEESSFGTVIHTSETDVKFYFYMAKAYASAGNAESAVHYLRRAMEDGFNDRKLIDQDPDFKKISQYRPFVELLQNPPVAIKN
jgi:tetratricopeptide (TPR) repeat protein